MRTDKHLPVCLRLSDVTDLRELCVQLLQADRSEETRSCEHQR